MSICFAPPLPALFTGGFHLPEMLMVLAVILLVFGPKQLPKIGRAMGGGIKEFKDGLKTGVEDEGEDEKSTTIEAKTAEPLPPGEQSQSAQSAEQPDRTQQS